MDKGFSKAFEYKVIYVLEIKDELHKGYLKVGDATLHTKTHIDYLNPNSRELNQAALTRIKSYTNTAGLPINLKYTELAIKYNKEGRLVAFRDYQVHDVLTNSGFSRAKLGDSTGIEWFEIDTETAKRAIKAVKDGYANLSNSDKKGKHIPIVFRPEQEDCITMVREHFKVADRFLINAKMRYGKTLVTLEIIKECGFSKTIILTHRPVVDKGWYEDFSKIFSDTEYVYGSKGTGYKKVEDLEALNKPYVYFASIQDLRGSRQVGGRFEKNGEVFSTIWDCVIVDEAHEGTTTALGEDTVKAVVKPQEGKTKFLALSGTPFNIIGEYEDNAIYTWDYVMEQERKSEWDKYHFGDSNPYDELPQLRIYTYSLGELLENKGLFFEDKAFNFAEFFRTFKGDIEQDHEPMPENKTEGDFVHEDDIWSFLNLLVKDDGDSQYPFSTDEYKNIFKHTLWMVPGVREAKALKKLMLRHPVFGNGSFEIVNVAGNGDEEEKSEEALTKVKNAIAASSRKKPYTITLSCGKLTTGVTVKEWTGVFMLAGSYSTSAANYLQTIFRVQSPCNEDGKIKETAYVFDFAPDRTLKMVSKAAAINTGKGKTKIGDKVVLGKFLNYMPVISIEGSVMEEYSATRLLQQIKNVYAEKVVASGFEDNALYNDELLKLTEVDIQAFKELKDIIGRDKANKKTSDIKVNEQGLTEEEHEELERIKGKRKANRTPEEEAKLKELQEKNKLRRTALDILRGISVRMPMLIYGADVDYDNDISLDSFVDLVDEESWKEFMPNGVTKEKFKEFQKYYDEEVFIAAGRKIRYIAREADKLDPEERVIKIASLFSCFKNPDKETVLTPWRVVNMHMSETLGGWDFYDEKHENTIDKPRFVDRGKTTERVFKSPNTQVLEINSKTGLYPLYVAYSIYKCKLDALSGEVDRIALWNQVLAENVFVICKTPMAKTITKRTLAGYTKTIINAHCFDDLVNTLKNKPKQFIEKVLRPHFWGKEGNEMKISAVVGNPPYQETVRAATHGNNNNTVDIFPYFRNAARELSNIVSLIYPAKELQRGDMNTMDRTLVKVRIYNGSSKEGEKNIPGEPAVFESVRRIPGDVGVFMWDKASPTEKINYQGVDIKRTTRILPVRKEFIPLSEKLESCIGTAKDYRIRKCCESNFVENNPKFVLGEVKERSARVPAGYTKVLTNDKGGSGGKAKWYYISTKALDYLQPACYKVVISSAYPNEAFKNPNSVEIIGPDEMFGRTKMSIYYSEMLEDAQNYIKYISTAFSKVIAQLTPYRFLYYLPDFDSIKKDIDWSKSVVEIEKQLFKKYSFTEDDIERIKKEVKA